MALSSICEFLAHRQRNGRSCLLVVVDDSTLSRVCRGTVSHCESEERADKGCVLRHGLFHLLFVTTRLLRGTCCNFVGRDSSVGIATRYVLDGPGIESR
jgi:hypothetical protein